MQSRALVVLSLIIAAVGLPTHTAAADSRSFADGSTTSGPMDLLRVVVINERRLRIRLHVDDLQRRTGRDAAVWIDTDASRAGAEFFIASGLYDSDWMIARARGWRVVGSGPLNCPVDQKLDSERDVIVWTTGRACLGRYSRVRVSAETRDRVTDYSPRRHTFHRWVARR